MLNDYAISLAAEGVPVCAIARSLQTKSETIREVLRGAIEGGRLVELPPEDWLQKSKTNGIMIGVPLEARERAARRLFRLSDQQARVFVALLLYAACTSEKLDRVMNRGKVVEADYCGKTARRVVVHNIRHKLERYSWFIIKYMTMTGYYCDGEVRKKALAMIDDYCVSNF